VLRGTGGRRVAPGVPPASPALLPAARPPSRTPRMAARPLQSARWRGQEPMARSGVVLVDVVDDLEGRAESKMRSVEP
jgi:hypothetical protein